MATLDARLGDARRALVAAGIGPDEAALDAELLARDLLGWDRAQLLTRRYENAPEGFDDAYAARVSRRARREPVAYIRGHQEFWGLEFEVTRDVLIPRPETELIVEEATQAARGLTSDLTIVDVGTGSGCIAIALAVELPASRIIATDVSAAALDVAGRNATRHRAGERITFVACDLLDGVTGPVDLIISNPPYVATTDVLPPEVVDYEPPGALFAGDDGLAILHRLLRTAPERLASGGALIVEFGYGQEPGLRALAESHAWAIDVRKDLQSIPRVAVLRR